MVAEPLVDVDSAVLDFKTAEGMQRSLAAVAAVPSELYEGRPMRVFRWYQGQRHYSGEYWSATERDLVPHESRLEKAALMIADFDPRVHHIAAQPFLLQANVNGKWVRHTLDYLLGTDDGPVVVDVMRAERLAHDKAQLLIAWTRRVVQSLGWSYVVFTEPSPVLLDNIRFLSGYRRDWLINQDILIEIRSRIDELVGLCFRDAEARFAHRCKPLVRSALLHLLWRQELIVDVTQPLQSTTVLEAPQ
ncbi:hypothetical protein ABIA30_005417 [Mycobacterium sp. MAA66]|uniref:TnsA-like heteromeric transposase endonuclease subunit n=1 Tax=Mycobacterium sp. MAA66 TaxID=3156297 RepID=UPI0035191A73